MLSDGAGNQCVPSAFPLPDLPTGDCNIDGLSGATAHLHAEHDVFVYAIGFGVDDGRQLVAIARNGGTSLDGYLEATDASELMTAFRALLDDPKICQ